jgi:hypothetical protein
MAGVTRVPSNYKLLGRHELTTSTTNSNNAIAVDDGLTLSIAYLPSRILRVTLSMHFLADGGSQAVILELLRGATSLGYFETNSISTTVVESKTFSRTILGPATGATETFKVKFAPASAATQVTSYASANLPKQLTVEDLGPQ